MEEVKSILEIIGTCLGLLITVSSVIIAIKQFIDKNKHKSMSEMLQMIYGVVDKAMVQVEQSSSGLTSDEKLQLCIDIITKELSNIGLDIGLYINQIKAYIEQTIKITKQINIK